MKSKELTVSQILSVPCAICGAAIDQACQLYTGTLRGEPHRARKLFAIDAIEATPSKRYTQSGSIFGVLWQRYEEDRE